MLSVQNYHRMREEKRQQELIDATVKKILESSTIETQTNFANSESNNEASEALIVEAKSVQEDDYEDDNDVDSVGIIALIVGGCALVVGTLNLMFLMQMKKEMKPAKYVGDKDDSVSISSEGLNSVN